MAWLLFEVDSMRCCPRSAAHLPIAVCHGTCDALWCSIRNQASQYR